MYLYTCRASLPEFAPGQRSCDCLHCRSHAWRDLCYWKDRQINRWHSSTTCRIHGHDFPDMTGVVLTWKMWCRRCLTTIGSEQTMEYAVQKLGPEQQEHHVSE